MRLIKSFLTERRAMEFGLWLFFIAFLFFPLPQLQDYLTNSGWFYLSSFSVYLAVLVSFYRKKIQVPKLQILIGIGILSLPFILSSLLHQSTFLEERWIQRYAVFLLSFLVYQLIADEKSLATTIRWPLSALLIFLCGESLYQYFSQCGFDGSLDRSCYSSRFWNINMLSQALVLALPFLFLNRKHARKYETSFFEVLVVLVSLVILLSACRSSILALALLTALEFLNPLTFSRKRFSLLALVTLLLFIPVNYSKNNLSNSLAEDKKSSADYRVEVWTKSIAMAKDFPLGVGPNNFEFGFLPYKKESNLPSLPGTVDKSPHNEFIRVLTEEGWPVFIVWSAALLSLLAIAGKSLLQRREIGFIYRFLICLLPEIFFQFPTEMFFPVFLFSMALISIPKAKEIHFSIPSKFLVLVVSLAILGLFTNRNLPLLPASQSANFCRIFPDNWKMCGDFTRAHLEAGDLEKASATLVPLIHRQPFNFIALHYDFLLGDPNRNAVITCNYWELFNGQAAIPGSDTSACQPSKDRAEMLKKFIDYSKTR